MNIVILDGYVENPGDLSWDGLRALGQVTLYDRTSDTDEREIVERLQGADIAVTSKVPITEAIMKQCPDLKFIAVTATGYNIIDVAAARKRNIPVSNVPTYGTDTVSQFTFGLLLELCHRIGHHDKVVHEGKWTNYFEWCFWDTPQIELAGKTLGIIGFGRIGRRVGEMAKAFHMRVLAFNHGHNHPTAVADYVDLDTLLQQSDVISLHCPLNEATKGMICKETLAKMKTGAFLLNTSRGGLVVEQDLAEALAAGKIAGAAVDVVSYEPIKEDNPLLKAPKLHPDSPYGLGHRGSPPADHGHHSGKCPEFPGRHAGECGGGIM